MKKRSPTARDVYKRQLDILSVNSHNIKSTGRILRIPIAYKIKQRSPADHFLLFIIYRCRCSAAAGSMPVLYFHKNQISSVSGDQVYFPGSAAEIPGFYIQSLLF